jgi:hypothetical protein
MKALLIALIALSSTSAFADKILAPGEFYTAKRAGEQVVCGGQAQPQEPDSYVFNAEGEAFMQDSEMNDPARCTGTNAKWFGTMSQAQAKAASNCVNIDCPPGYSCKVMEGTMEYRPRGQICHAFLPCRATRR